MGLALYVYPRMQNASLLPVPELTPAAEYIPLSPPSYVVAEEYAMGMLSALQGTAALGAGLHIAGSLLIVYGQTLVKVCMLISVCPTTCKGVSGLCFGLSLICCIAEEASVPQAWICITLHECTTIVIFPEIPGGSIDGGNIRGWQMLASSTPTF